jgi:hypothetical protein
MVIALSRTQELGLYATTPASDIPTLMSTEQVSESYLFNPFGTLEFFSLHCIRVTKRVETLGRKEASLRLFSLTKPTLMWIDTVFLWNAIVYGLLLQNFLSGDNMFEGLAENFQPTT